MDPKEDPSLFEEPDLPGEIADESEDDSWINNAEMENALHVMPEPKREYYGGFPI